MNRITVTIQIRFFASARDISGKAEGEIKVPKNISPTDLHSIIVEQFSLQLIRQNIVLALNEEYIQGSAEIELNENDIVAVIPPLSGG